MDSLTANINHLSTANILYIDFRIIIAMFIEAKQRNLFFRQFPVLNG